jgi:hypothetical protein
MFILGGLLLLMGSCVTGMLWVPGMQDAMARQSAALPPGTTFEGLRLQFTIMGVLMVGVALLMIVLGGFVRTGSKGATITSIVLSILLICWMLIEIVGGLVQGSNLGMAGQAAIGACMLVVPLGLLTWLLIWLFQSKGAITRWVAWQSQYGAQYQYYAQGQQAAYPPQQPSQQPQNWQQPGQGQWGQPAWPPQPQQQQQNWPPPSPPPPPPGNET